MNHAIPLPESKLTSIRCGEALAMATVAIVFTAAILAIVAYKLFVANKAKLELPGGYKFEWTQK